MQSLIGLDFKQCKRLLADPFDVPLDYVSPDYLLEVIDLQSSEATRVTFMAGTKTLLDFNTSLCQRHCLSENALVEPSVFGSTFGSSAKAAHEINWIY